MDNERWHFFKLLALLLLTLLPTATSIVSRDLVLTPRQDLEPSGKSLYYMEDASERSHTERPWERTLKHVTYITLFANAAQEMGKNVSELKAYREFLQSPYVVQRQQPDTRFGDIIMLAQGRLEVTSNGNYRFIEGLCNWQEALCEASQVRALWRVQKIRHRDVDRKFRYEIRYSVSPIEGMRLPQQNQDNGVQQTYIQKAEDYPQNFNAKLNGKADIDRSTNNNPSRNFREASLTNYRQSALVSQPTFIHSIFHAPPALIPRLPPHPEMQVQDPGFGAYKTPIRMDLLPNLYSLMNGDQYPTPTTYRPLQPPKLPQPNIYKPPGILEAALPQQSPMLHTSTPVTHHYHHHFYMPGSEENGFSASGGNRYADTGAAQIYHYPKIMKPERGSLYFSKHDGLHNANFMRAALPEYVVQVTPVPPLKKKQILKTLLQTRTMVPFIQSEPYNEGAIRYSEPDPLYTTTDDFRKSHSNDATAPTLISLPISEVPSQEPDNGQGNGPYRDEVQEESTKQHFTEKYKSTTEEPTINTTFAAQKDIVTPTIARPSTLNNTGEINEEYFPPNSTVDTTLSVVSPSPHTQSKQTSTEKTALKWKPRSRTPNRKVTDQLKSASKKSVQEKKLTLLPQTGNNLYEVLTQKSVSKSVSVKVGSNGQEIPIIVDDDSSNDKP